MQQPIAYLEMSGSGDLQLGTTWIEPLKDCRIGALAVQRYFVVLSDDNLQPKKLQSALLLMFNPLLMCTYVQIMCRLMANINS